LGLLLSRAERTADLAGEKVHRDGCRDALARAAVTLDRRRLGGDQKNPAVWGALGVVRRDAPADGCLELPRLGAGAEKLAVLEPACLVPDALTSDVLVDPAAAL